MFRVLALAVALVVAGAAPAAAHGIGGDAADKSVLEFVPIGTEHMLLGWDHLLFILAVVLLAGELKRAAKLITVFVVGHSTTLIIATMAGWRVSPGWVDVVIALSIVFVGVVGMRGRPSNWTWFGAGVLGFGLVHGLGLSTRLQDLGLPEDGLLPRVVAFNVGIEIGQLLAILVVVGLGKLLLMTLRNPEFLQRPEVGQFSCCGLAVVGVLAATYLANDAAKGENPYDRIASTSPADCDTERTEAPNVLKGGHPSKSFYGADEKLPVDDFGHIVGDGLMTIRYAAGLEPGALQDIRTFVAATEYVVAGPVADQSAAVHVVTQRQTLTCAGLYVPTLIEFSETWFKEWGS